MRSAALAVLLLAGCISPEQIARNNYAAQQQEESARTAYRERLMSSCESIGYQRNTDQWRQCIMQLHAQNQQRNTALGAALLQGAASQPRVVPSCRGLPPGTAGYARSQGQCW